MEQLNEYQLTEDEKGMVMPMVETIENVQREVQSVLNAITRLRKLDGHWTLIGSKLVRAGGQPQQPQAQPLEAVPTAANGRG